MSQTKIHRHEINLLLRYHNYTGWQMLLDPDSVPTPPTKLRPPITIAIIFKKKELLYGIKEHCAACSPHKISASSKGFINYVSVVLKLHIIPCFLNKSETYASIGNHQVYKSYTA